MRVGLLIPFEKPIPHFSQRRKHSEYFVAALISEFLAVIMDWHLGQIRLGKRAELLDIGFISPVASFQFTIAPPQHLLYFFPDPHGHGSFRPTLGVPSPRLSRVALTSVSTSQIAVVSVTARCFLKGTH